MKKYIMLFLMLSMQIAAVCCPVCDQRQPRLLKGITHGAGPESNWDYLIISAVSVIVLLTFFYSVKWLLQPGEQGDDHIKRFI
ncbi:hypothetical protein SAMN04487995_2591 [Dyadobacter koreensis]|uniref:Uncharacterized protein n=1 Tax=Dyadobacter koreensis TaxID=408657 RepID=A0A1H6UKL3_9BACT|nr:hypothetical protein [Dyadobacter koreensis]SEI92838.1 hypothetical protein SAMN04487995_2591 [Dyadobacter koreensis]